MILGAVFLVVGVAMLVFNKQLSTASAFVQAAPHSRLWRGCVRALNYVIGLALTASGVALVLGPPE